MIETKQMPCGEKLEGILRLDKLVGNFAPRVVKEELGEEKLQELQNIWKTQSEPTPTEASDKDKYEIAYRNLIMKWVTANNLMGKYDGEDGTSKYMKAAIAGWKKQYNRTSPILKTIWGLSPKTGFQRLTKQLAYSLQVFSPLTVTESTEKQMTLSMSPCKIVGLPNGSDFCVMACQNIIPAWLGEQFSVKMISHRKGTDCTVTFAPFDK
jgi:hypothetical protein